MSKIMSVEGSNVDFSVKNIPVNKPFSSVDKFGEILKANDSVTTLAEKTEIQIDKIPTDEVPKKPEQTNSLSGRIGAFFSNVANSLVEQGKNFFTGCVVVIPFTAANLGVARLQGYGSSSEAESLFFKTNYDQFIKRNPQFEGKVTFKAVKVTAFVGLCVLVPIVEEIIFRKGIQKMVLSRVIKDKTNAEKEGGLEATTAKNWRVGITSLLFGASHLSNDKLIGKDAARRQAIGTIGLGAICGQLKESKPGLMGAIGAHITNNTIAMLPLFMA